MQRSMAFCKVDGQAPPRLAGLLGYGGRNARSTGKWMGRNCVMSRLVQTHLAHTSICLGCMTFGPFPAEFIGNEMHSKHDTRL